MGHSCVLTGVVGRRLCVPYARANGVVDAHRPGRPATAPQQRPDPLWGLIPELFPEPDLGANETIHALHTSSSTVDLAHVQPA